MVNLISEPSWREMRNLQYIYTYVYIYFIYNSIIYTLYMYYTRAPTYYYIYIYINALHLHFRAPTTLYIYIDRLQPYSDEYHSGEMYIIYMRRRRRRGLEGLNFVNGILPRQIGARKNVFIHYILLYRYRLQVYTYRYYGRVYKSHMGISRVE